MRFGRLSRVVADLVRFQRLTGCRPGEVCSLTPSMVDRYNPVRESLRKPQVWH
jgi:hypothetical protein